MDKTTAIVLVIVGLALLVASIVLLRRPRPEPQDISAEDAGELIITVGKAYYGFGG